MSEVITLLGMHGTCIGIAQKIQKYGFKLSSSGRKGPGAYFWSYETDSRVARDLSIDWWSSALGRGCFSNYPKPNNGCAVLDCKASVHSDEFLDLLEPTMSELMMYTILELMDKEPMNDGEDSEDYLSRMASLFINELESELGVRSKVIKTTVDHVVKLKNKKNIYHRWQMMNGRGYPILVVRDDASVIHVMHIEEVPKDECA